MKTRHRKVLRIARKSADGFILVAVLWILGGLAVLAAIYTLYVVNAATSLEVNNDRIQADASVSAALELTAYYLSAVKPEERPASGQFNYRVGGSNAAVGFLSESARIDLNMAPQPLLAGLFRVLGADTDSANSYAERIIGWRTNATSPNPDQDKEVTAYRNAGLTYNPREAPFTNVQELWLVLGLPPALVERAMPFVTVFSGLPNINVMDAAPEVIAALPGMTPDRLDAVLKQRAALSTDARPVLQLLGPAQSSATAAGSNAIRVFVQVGLARGRRINAEAVILLLEDAPDPYRVLSWTDDFDG
jgi:general secretion pathway protein K